MFGDHDYGYRIEGECPECGADLVYDEGHAQTFEEPAQPETLYCEDCGWETWDLEYSDWASDEPPTIRPRC